ncbi:MAG: hypothetical protein ACREXY_03735 [Gammaproteobacteria bacterium]
MADGNGSNPKPRATREPHIIRVGNSNLVVPVGTTLGDLLFDAGMFLSEAMAMAEGMAGESDSELNLRADALQGLRHLMNFSKDMVEAVSTEVARG